MPTGLTDLSSEFMALTPPGSNRRFLKLGKPSVRKLNEKPQSDQAAALRKAAEDFEAVFLFQMMKQMRSGMQKEEMFHGGMGEDVFSEMLDEEFSKKMAGHGSVGIADMLFKQLSRQFGIEDTGAKSGRSSALPLPSEAAQTLQEKLRTAQSQTHTRDPSQMAPDPSRR